MPRQLIYVNRYLLFVLAASVLIVASLPATAASWDDNTTDLANTVFQTTAGLNGNYALGGVDPTDIGTTVVGSGVNLVTGNSIASPLDFDALTFTVLPGQTVTAIDLTFTGQAARINLTELTNAATDPDTFTLLTGTESIQLNFNDPVGTPTQGAYELLGGFGISPLGAGTYGFDIRNAFPSGHTLLYNLDITVIPEPASIGLLAAGALLILRRRPARH